VPSKGPTAARFLVNIDVPDLERAVAFYVRGMGLTLSRRLFGGTVAEMTGAPATIYLLQKEAGSPPLPGSGQRRDYARHWTPVHLDFIVDALEPALERALAAGAKLEGKVETFEWGRQAVMSDPFGNGVCLIQWLGGGYDAVEAPGPR
jgi:predicted enzyme related to lactoylglutathione lyase